ncbi:oxygen-regulated protein 1 [Aeromonas phage ZPAH1]|nr:hypothetical protein ASwh1_28 [Aeromonas phage Aswh_1]QQG33838.1 oxygen-regulated protein 1 [Aeromonas phage ZPAH1]
MFALAHKETGKFAGWEVFTSFIDGETTYNLTEYEYADNVWCVPNYLDIQYVLNRGQIRRDIDTGYSDPDVGFPLEDYEIVVLTGCKV